MTDYKIVNGTAYHKETNDYIVNLLEGVRNSPTARVRVCYGDVVTGLDWGERYDVCGYVGRSTGELKVLLLILKTTSLGGGTILDHRIVKLEIKDSSASTYITFYKHPKYHKETQA